jgi:uncharacterized protein YbjT (DUF2867 family)
MDRNNQTILVVGATGNQGGVATNHLLADGWRVRALTHHPDSPASQTLVAAGVELVSGDLLDSASLDAAVDGVYGVFSMQAPPQGDFNAEETEGVNIADAAAAAGVRHFVYNSVAGAESESATPWVAAKHHIEEHIRSLGLPATIWRPVTFMENYLRQRDGILGGHLKSPLWPESVAYLIALEDVGRFVALAFSDPDRFVGTSMAIGGDSMTMTEVAETFSRALGTKVEFEHAEFERIPTPSRPVAGQPQPVRADIAACRELLPELNTLGLWIEKTGWKALVAHELDGALRGPLAAP